VLEGKRYYFREQNREIGYCNASTACLLRGTNYIFKYKIKVSVLLYDTILFGQYDYS